MKRCWEYKNCKREDCIVQKNYKNSARIPPCWYVAGTLCGGKIQGEYAQKIGTCKNCDYYDYVYQNTHSKKQQNNALKS